MEDKKTGSERPGVATSFLSTSTEREDEPQIILHDAFVAMWYSAV